MAAVQERIKFRKSPLKSRLEAQADRQIEACRFLLTNLNLAPDIRRTVEKELRRLEGERDNSRNRSRF